MVRRVRVVTILHGKAISTPFALVSADLSLHVSIGLREKHVFSARSRPSIGGLQVRQLLWRRAGNHPIMQKSSGGKHEAVDELRVDGDRSQSDVPVRFARGKPF